MLIEHTTKRAGGSIHTIEGVKYHFKPAKTDAHVCNVDDPDHAKRFLAIDTFVIAGKATQAPPAPKPAPAPVQEPVKQDTTPEPTPAPQKSDDDDDNITALEELPDDELARIFEQAVGKKPHHALKRETIIERIRAAMQEE
ncbi:hypothetical protein [Yoonia sp.]|uniref:hypothetical protein n=1 Tax=Yoonia sp. TaxID=2212373 RepID=UPI002DF75D5C|nr:hypothetical protein [Yoonia sp.]